MSHYLIISGNGRSGSNRLLDILDHSARTVCRNETDEILGGDFNRIGRALFPDDITEASRDGLPSAIAKARTRRSGRDRLPVVAKDYHRSHRLAQVFHWVMFRKRLRQGLRRFHLIQNDHEWTIPGVVVNDKIADAVLTLKLNARPAWAIYLHETDPNARIIHNIRDPHAYMNSWYNRFALKIDPDHFEKRFGDVPRIFAHFGQENYERLQDLSKDSLMEIELWRWRFVNETLHVALKGSDRAMTMTYNSVDEDPEQTAEALYDFAGLPLSNAAAERVKTMRNTLFAKKHSVRLENAQIDALVDRVLADSPLLDIL